MRDRLLRAAMALVSALAVPAAGRGEDRAVDPARTVEGRRVPFQSVEGHVPDRASTIPDLDPDGVQRVRILAGDYFFRPDLIVVKAGYPVELLVRQQTALSLHDLTLKAPEAGIEVSVALGRRPRSIRFVPTRPGRFVFYCSQKPPFGNSHRDRGMVGTLEVVE